MTQMRTIAQRLMPRPRPVARPGMLFVRGHPRSGTNWVSALLNLHPHVHCTGEFHLEPVWHAVEQSKTYPWQLMATEPVRSELDQAFQDLLRRCITVACRKERPHARLAWIGDRTPRDLLDWVPDGRYIWVLRDGRDVMVSWTFHQLRMGPDVIAKSIPDGPRDYLCETSRQFQADPDLFKRRPELLLANEQWVRRTATTWNRRYRNDSAVAGRMQSGPGPSPLLCLRYEALRAETEPELRRIFEFLGLDPSQARAPSHRTGTAPGFGREDAQSFRRKGEVGDWQNYFTPEAKRWFREIAGESLIDAGYAENDDW